MRRGGRALSIVFSICFILRFAFLSFSTAHRVKTVYAAIKDSDDDDGTVNISSLNRLQQYRFDNRIGIRGLSTVAAYFFFFFFK